MPFAKQNDVVQAIPRDRVNKRAGFRFWQAGRADKCLGLPTISAKDP